MIPITLTVNGRPADVVVEPRTSLADLLREQLRLTGTHLGCEQGACGACTVLVDGASVRSCLMFAAQADGTEVETVESLASGDELNPLQQAFADCRGLQCGFCTPGFLMAASELLQEDPDPTEATVREALSGNICRCTGYEGIVAAVRAAARAHASGEDAGSAPNTSEKSR